MAGTPAPESPDALAIMKAALKTPFERVHLLLAVGLLAACVANIALVWAWLGD